MAEQEQNRNESATPHKKSEARKKGSVPKSLDLNSFVAMAAFVAALYFWGAKLIADEMKLAQKIFLDIGHASFEIADLSNYVSELIATAFIILTPFFLLLMVLGLLANFIQVGLIFTFFPLKPDLTRINPITGFKRLFSMRMLMEAVKSILKFALLGTVLYFVMKSSIPRMVVGFDVLPQEAGKLLMPELKAMLTKLLIALGVIAMLDFTFSRWEYNKRLRMSKREITDEFKHREGDPRIKSRIRELQREALKRAKSLSKVKDADVLITNPTHFAVALQYDRDEMDAPVVTAKGAGFLAARMRAVAKRNRVPIVENKKLARSLFNEVDIDKSIPLAHYSLVARILFWAYKLKGKSLRK